MGGLYFWVWMAAYSCLPFFVLPPATRRRRKDMEARSRVRKRSIVGMCLLGVCPSVAFVGSSQFSSRGAMRNVKATSSAISLVLRQPMPVLLARKSLFDEDAGADDNDDDEEEEMDPELKRKQDRLRRKRTSNPRQRKEILAFRNEEGEMEFLENPGGFRFTEKTPGGLSDFVGDDGERDVSGSPEGNLAEGATSDQAFLAAGAVLVLTLAFYVYTFATGGLDGTHRFDGMVMPSYDDGPPAIPTLSIPAPSDTDLVV